MSWHLQISCVLCAGDGTSTHAHPMTFQIESCVSNVKHFSNEIFICFLFFIHFSSYPLPRNIAEQLTTIKKNARRNIKIVHSIFLNTHPGLRGYLRSCLRSLIRAPLKLLNHLRLSAPAHCKFFLWSFYTTSYPAMMDCRATSRTVSPFLQICAI